MLQASLLHTIAMQRALRDLRSQSLMLSFAAGIMHLFGHVTEAQADSGYTAYFPIGVFLITLGFYLFFFIQRVLGPLLAPQVAGQAAGAGGASCCAAAVPFSKVRESLLPART